MLKVILICLLSCPICANSTDVISHRGNCCEKTENTLESISGAWELGFDAVEIDLRVTADGVIILFHDEKIADKKISSLTYSKLSENNNSIPSLSSVLSLGIPAGYYILDLKQQSDLYLDNLINIIQTSKFPLEKVYFQSDKLETLKTLKNVFTDANYIFVSRLDRRFPWVFPPSSRRIISGLKKHEIDHVSLKGRSFIDRKFLCDFKNKDIKVFVWTINDPDRVGFYTGIGVDGVITDNSQALKTVKSKLLRERCEIE